MPRDPGRDHEPAPAASPRPDRRRFLRLTGRAAVLCLAAPALHQLGGCGEAEQAAPTSLRIPLAELPDGARVRHELAGVPIEVRRTGEEITARSLLCTHQGCEVEWVEDEQHYFCPCHEGLFDADGNVIEGMPTRPLRPIAVRREGDAVVIGS
jgi:cytochrome b6-f complex iron-sulfur subunit